MQFAVMTVRKNKFLTAIIVGILFVIAGTLVAQNPDLTQNPAPSADLQSQMPNPPDQTQQDQLPQDQTQMQEQEQEQGQDQSVMQDQGQQDQGQDQGPANPPTLGPRPDSQQDQNDRPPMSELPPKPSPNVGPNGANPA
jgi:hypothetical protein